MNEMIDRVARAIMVKQGCGLTIEGEHVFCSDPRASDPRLQCECKMAARAAIAAMRTPTQAMQRAGFRNNRFESPVTCDHPLCVSRVTLPADEAWRAMIDEALREEGA